MTQQRKNPVGDFKPRGADVGGQILEELRAVNSLLTEKATPEEAAAFREFLLTSAQRSADAAKEGGFMGFKAERVSEGEQRMLDKLREVLSIVALDFALLAGKPASAALSSFPARARCAVGLPPAAPTAARSCPRPRAAVPASSGRPASRP